MNIPRSAPAPSFGMLTVYGYEFQAPQPVKQQEPPYLLLALAAGAGYWWWKNKRKSGQGGQPS